MGVPNFRTSLPTLKANFQFNHHDHIMGIGSCFAQNIGQQLQLYKFSALLNPFGILYNPISMQRCLEMVLEGRAVEETSLFEHRGLWQHFDFHSQFANPDFPLAFRQINQAISSAHHFLQKTNRLVLTFGTAYAFRQIKNNEIVGNCHKLPSDNFQRTRLDIDEITTALIPTLEKLYHSLPNLEIVISISPIRHLKDGLLQNQKSKATLLLAADVLCKHFPKIHYFPAYEIMMDDLRDYRFYESDMLHPNATALEYIWQFFQDTFFERDTLQLNQAIQAIVKASQHRPLHPEAHSELSTFAERQLKKIAAIQEGKLFLDFDEEERHFRKLIH